MLKMETGRLRVRQFRLEPQIEHASIYSRVTMIFFSPTALDLAEYCVMLLEDDILFNAGKVLISS
jgi:isoaspartyl peptidase/L-asparaginase-like protein (Ntn-hydrolase superfamily)